MNIALVFGTLRIISLSRHHSQKFFKSASRRLHIEGTLGPEVYRVASSANSSKIQYLMCCGKSLIYIIKSNGPKTEPCGTPARISLLLDSLLEILTCWCLFDKYDVNQLRVDALNLYRPSFCSRIRWLTKSKVLVKSKNSAPTVSLLFKAVSQVSVILVKDVRHECLCLKPDCCS